MNELLIVKRTEIFPLGDLVLRAFNNLVGVYPVKVSQQPTHYTRVFLQPHTLHGLCMPSLSPVGELVSLYIQLNSQSFKFSKIIDKDFTHVIS